MTEFKQHAEIFVCDCSSREHQIVFEYDIDDNMVYSHIHLTNYGFWGRLKKGLRYIFGYKCCYGHWDEFVWTIDHADKLEELSKILKKNHRFVCTE